jgi:hypothetical protein
MTQLSFQFRNSHVNLKEMIFGARLIEKLYDQSKPEQVLDGPFIR